MNPVEFFQSQGLYVTSPYGPRVHPITGVVGSFHNGVDFGGKPAGTPLLTPREGVVVAAQYYPSRGNTAVVRMRDGVRQLYQHLQAFKCRVGERLSEKAVVGLLGSTGDSTGPHLHYELRLDGDPWGAVWGDPAKYEWEVFDVRAAIVVKSFADLPAVEPLAIKIDAPVYFREGCGTLDAETVIVAGGDAKIFERPGVKVVCLSGGDRWETATLVGEYYRRL